LGAISHHSPFAQASVLDDALPQQFFPSPIPWQAGIVMVATGFSTLLNMGCLAGLQHPVIPKEIYL